MMEKNKLYTVGIAGLVLQIHSEKELIINESFTAFLLYDTEPDVQAVFQEVEELPVIQENVVYEDYFYKVHQDKDGYLYSFFNAPRDLSVYAIAASDKKMTHICIDYLENGSHCVSELRNCFSHLNFESILIRRKRLFFHAACVDTHLGGLLFTGRSGAGKSTQAELWNKYRSAVHVNGDRPILSKGKVGWKAWGSPYAGSSKYHVNRNCSVTAIIMLRQSSSCCLRKLRMKEAFRAVWEGITVHSWDKVFVEEASGLVMELISGVPVYEFYCTPDEYAVDYLEKCLRKEWGLCQHIIN